MADKAAKEATKRESINVAVNSSKMEKRSILNRGWRKGGKGREERMVVLQNSEDSGRNALTIIAYNMCYHTSECLFFRTSPQLQMCHLYNSL